MAWGAGLEKELVVARNVYELTKERQAFNSVLSLLLVHFRSATEEYNRKEIFGSTKGTVAKRIE